MKQNFQMGTYEGLEILGVEKKDNPALIGALFCDWEPDLIKRNDITNLRPVTVLDIAPEKLFEWLKYTTTTNDRSLVKLRHALSTDWHITYSKIRDQLTPTPPPKNEVGKVCVTEPNWGETISAYTNGNTKTEWLACTDPDTQKRIYTTVSGAKANWLDLINPILLSEG